MSKMNRRQFLYASSALSVSSTVFLSSYVPAHAFGANNRVRVAIIGVGGQGNNHIHSFGKLKDVELAWVVDPDKNRANAAKERIQKEFSTEVKSAQDARVMFEDSTVDAVSVVTCNHWHSLMGIWALQAGKHVYVEKPCSQNLFEGRQLSKAAAKYGKCVQHGTQRRSENRWLRGAVAWASGKYGKPVALQAFANRERGNRGFKPECAPPDYLDWNLWVGPAAMVPFHENYVPYNWHWFWNFGNGEIGNNGVHYFDLCRIAMTEKNADFKHPKSVLMFGTRFFNNAKNNYTDQAETPNIQLGIYDFDGIPLIFQSCNYASKNTAWKRRETAYFITDEGYFEADKFYPKTGSVVQVKDTDVKIIPRKPGGHHGNFVECIRENTPQNLNAPIEEGHYSSSVCHLGNASYRMGAPASLAECRNAVGDHPVMQTTIDETLENLQNVWQGRVKLDETIPWTLGKKLTFNSETELFENDDAANQLLTRPERAPFIVPTEV